MESRGFVLSIHGSRAYATRDLPSQAKRQRYQGFARLFPTSGRAQKVRLR